VAQCLDGALAGLAVLASQALYKQGRQPPQALETLTRKVRAIVAPVDDPRPLGGECGRLYERLVHGATGEMAPFI